MIIVGGNLLATQPYGYEKAPQTLFAGLFRVGLPVLKLNVYYSLRMKTLRNTDFHGGTELATE